MISAEEEPIIITTGTKIEKRGNIKLK